jgi:hypothetical protein
LSSYFFIFSAESVFEPVQITCKNHANIGYGGTPLTWCLRLRRGFIDNLLILKRFLISNELSLATYFLAFFEAIEHHSNLHYNSTPPPSIENDSHLRFCAVCEVCADANDSQLVICADCCAVLTVQAVQMRKEY